MKRFIALALSAILLLTILAGCSGGESKAPPASTETPQAQETTAPSTVPPPAPTDNEPAKSDTPEPEPEPTPEAPPYFPIDHDLTLSIFWDMAPMIDTMMETPSDITWARWLSAQTGINIDIQGAVIFFVEEKANLMIASGDYTDIVASFSQYYKAGNDSAIEDEIIYDLAPYIEEYMPNYTAQLNSSDINLLQAYTDNGYMPCIYGFNSPDAMPVYGPVIRSDLMEKVGVTKLPETYDDYYDLCVKFKNELGIANPLWISYTGGVGGNALSGGFGVAENNGANGIEGPFFNDPITGQVKYGPMEDAFLEYLTMMHDWYQQGIIYQDFYADTDTNQMFPKDSLVANNEIAIWFSDDGTIPQFADKNTDPNFRVVGAAYPVKNAGDKNYFGRGIDNKGVKAGDAFAITTKCRDIEAAMRMTDLFFTDEGRIFCNYGTRGETFEFDANGVPQYTDLITSNPSGLPTVLAISYYCMYFGPFVEEFDRFYNMYTDDQKDAVNIWVTENYNPVLPALTQLESEEFSMLATDIQTFYSEKLVKFITGEEPLSNFDAFRDTLRTLKIDRVLAIKQQAYDRYMNKLSKLG